MIKELHIPLSDLIVCLTSAIDLLSPALINHHKRVAYIAHSISSEMGLSTEKQNDLFFAGLLHDVGALSLKERLDLLGFEVKNPHQHAKRGYLLLKGFKPFSKLALLIRYHHAHWSKKHRAELNGKEVPMGSHILHLADRVAVLIKAQEEILGQVKGICERVVNERGKLFLPDAVDAFMSLSGRESFWLDIMNPPVSSILVNEAASPFPTFVLSIAELFDLAKLFCLIIDSKSRFTATHSSGVAASAETLARLFRLSGVECQTIKIAGYLHDLGKLAVPTEILEKPTKLTNYERNVIKRHTFFTYRLLEPFGDLRLINEYASFHHERLDGNGYPFHLKGEDLSIGARIMAVADVFTAINEDRPYRKGMVSNEVLTILERLGGSSALDPMVISTLRIHYDQLDSILRTTQEKAYKKYQDVERKVVRGLSATRHSIQ